MESTLLSKKVSNRFVPFVPLSVADAEHNVKRESWYDKHVSSTQHFHEPIAGLTRQPAEPLCSEDAERCPLGEQLVLSIDKENSECDTSFPVQGTADAKHRLPLS